jgi:hypothetical protein
MGVSAQAFQSLTDAHTHWEYPEEEDVSALAEQLRAQCGYVQSFEYVHVPAEQHVAPAQVVPPHWPYIAEQPDGEGVGVVDGSVVDGVVDVGEVDGSVLVGVPVPGFCSVKTTTPFAGNVYESEFPFATVTFPETGRMLFGAVSVFDVDAEPESEIVCAKVATVKPSEIVAVIEDEAVFATCARVSTEEFTLRSTCTLR